MAIPDGPQTSQHEVHDRDRRRAPRFIAAIGLLAALPGWTDLRGTVRVEPVSAGKSYDFVVHVRNIPEIKYNPEVKEDRRHTALNLVKRQCPGGRVVGEDKLVTETLGITSSPPDYIVLVKCDGRHISP